MCQKERHDAAKDAAILAYVCVYVDAGGLVRRDRDARNKIHGAASRIGHK